MTDLIRSESTSPPLPLSHIQYSCIDIDTPQSLLVTATQNLISASSHVPPRTWPPVRYEKQFSIISISYSFCVWKCKLSRDEELVKRYNDVGGGG